MAKFFDVIGFGIPEEKAPGVWVDVIVEHSYYGDVLRNTKSSTEGEYLNNDISVNNSISILADAYANDHFFAIKYAKWQGTLWTISKVEVQSPRLLLSIGRKYNGPTPVAP